MANARRIERLQKVILQAAANHIQRELQDPRIGLVSVTRVKLSPDLAHARLYWSVLGEEAEVRKCERGLQNALGSIQRAVAEAMQTRVTPQLELRHDESLAKAQRLEEIFSKLREERGEPAEGEDAGGAGDEADPGGRTGSGG